MEPVGSFRHLGATLFVAALLGLLVLFPLGWSWVQMFVAWDSSSLSLVFGSVLGRSLVATAVQALLSALLTLVFATILALGLSCWSAGVRLRGVAESVGAFCFFMPSVAVSLLCVEFFRAWGVEASGLGAILWAHVFMNFLYVGTLLSRSLVGTWVAGGRDLYWVWRSLGASPWEAGSRYLVKTFREDYRRWGTLVFLWSSQAFSTVLILGAGTHWLSPEVLLFYTIQQDLLSTRVLVLSLVQAAVSLGVFMWLQPREGDDSPTAGISEVVDLKIPRLWLGLALGGSLLLFGAPLVWSFVQVLVVIVSGAWSRELIQPTLYSVGLGLLVAASSALFVLVLSISRDVLVKNLGWMVGVSSTLLAGFWMYLGWDQIFQTSLLRLLLVAVVLTVLLLPQLGVMLRSVMERLNEDHWSAARVAGASPWRAHWSLLGPLLEPVVFRAARAGFLVGLGDLSVAVLFVPDLNLLPSMARRLSSQYDFSASFWILGVMMMGSAVWVAGEVMWKHRRRRA
jgi:ABC-type Fe3+ transport system permease subunit